jgi:serine phosphatase RsbU (regulator of sigma subunit)
MRIKTVFIGFWVLFGLFLRPDISHAQISEGYIDLSSHNFAKDNYTLSGSWEFYRKALLTPADIHKGFHKEKKEYFSVPGLWENMQKEKLQNGMGYGTYRVRFKVNSSIPLLSLNLNKVQNAYKLWINDSLYAEVGQVGKSRDEMQPKWFSRNYTFRNQQPENEIVLQVSNFYHKKGGLEHSPYIGLPDKIEKSSWRTLGFDHFIMGLLLIMAVYHFGLFLLKRNEWTVLFFGLLTLSSVLFTLTVGEIAISYFIPDFSWEFLVKINYISNYARALFFGVFIGFLFPTKFRYKIMSWAAGFALIMILFTLFTPARIYSHTLVVFLAYVVLVVLFFVGVTVDAVIKKKQGAVYSLLGTAVLFAAIINDVVKELFLINTPSTTTYGLFLFVLLQADMLAYRSTASFKELSKLTARLLTLTKIKDELLANNSLEPHRPLQVIARNINAGHAMAVIKQNDEWRVVAEYFNGKILTQKSNNVLDFNKTDNYTADYDLIKSALESKRIRFRYKPAGRKSMHKNGRYFVKVCMPITKGTDIISLFYAENSEPYQAFDYETERLLSLIKPQLSVITQNALAFSRLEKFNADLEETVRERTEEIIQQSEELRAQKEEIEAKNTILDEAAKEISQQNSHISDSINYAKRIQQALFPTDKELKQAFPDSYVFFKPKDVLSGDFYWTGIIETQGKTYSILAVADATGHGVPGALMSVIGDNLLSAAVYEKGFYKPSDIISYLDKELTERLDKAHSNQFEADGINIGVFSYNEDEGTGLYSGAYHPLYLTQKGELKQFKGRNKSAGIPRPESLKVLSYFDHELAINEGTLYLCSDGYIKQISDVNVGKFTRKDFKSFLKYVSRIPFGKQKEQFEKQFQAVKGQQEQTDDVLIAAVNFEQKK